MNELRLLGAVEFLALEDADPSLLVAHQKSFGLLAYLVAARPFGAHRRDSLVTLLWPEVDEAHARASLRKTLHVLRRAIGAEAIVSNGGETIGIAVSRLWCDVRAFDAALRTGRPVDALALYRGEFLPGFFVSDAPEFERWVEREREWLHAGAVRAAWAAADESSRAGNTTDCVAWSRRALQLAPDDEPGTRRLMSLLEEAGDRAGAMRAYQQFERYLARELGVGPSPETTSLIAGIRATAAPSPPHGANTLAASEPTQERLAELPATARGGRLAERPPRARWRIPAAMVLAIATALAVVSAVAATRDTSKAGTTLDNTHVAVMSLDNETGRPDLAFVGMEVQDWLSRGLQETGLVRVYAAANRVGATPPDANGRVPADGDRNWAKGLGAGLLVRGRYYLRADSIRLEVSIVDVGDGGVLATIAPVVGSAKDPTAAIDVLRRRTIAVLATHVDPALKQWAGAASQPPSFEAYREFSAGQQAKNRDDYDAAITHYRRAAVLDSGYVYPILMAAQLEMQVRSKASAVALLRAVRTRHLSLAPFDAALADVLEAQLAQDFERAFDATQRLRRYVTPGSDWELEAAAMANALNRPRVALEIAKSVDLHRPAVLDQWDVFVPITNAYHLSGENEALLALLRKEAGKWQHAPFIVVVEMQALAALSRPAEAESLWRTLLPNRAHERRGIVMWAAWEGARELRAHGWADAARRLANDALDSLPTLPASSPFGNPLRWKMQVLRESGRPREALAIAEAFAAKNPNEANMAAIIGALSAELGDTVRARRIEASLGHWPADADPGSVLIARARIAAALGDQAAAVALLHAACDRGCGIFEDLHIVLEFNGLRSYPPFRELLRPKSGT